MQAVILAGGRGKRLAERLDGRPKPLVDVCGVPLLERQIQALEDHGVNDFVVLVNHRADAMEAFFSGRNSSSKIVLIDDGTPRGTAGATLAAVDYLAERFLIVYGDTLFDIDVEHMMSFHREAGAELTLFLHPNDHPADSDLVELDEAGWVTRFHGYPHPAGIARANLVNAAFYICERHALMPWLCKPGVVDFAKDLFPEMLEAGQKLRAYVSYEYIKDIGTPARLDKAERHLRSGVVDRASRRSRQKAVFLDRDGTLNALKDYVRIPEDLVLLPGVGEGVHRLNEAEYRIVVVTNQPVLARGECDVPTMQRIHARLETSLGESGAYADAIRFCPHHPDAGFEGEVVALKVSCECRKPGVKMFTETANEMNINLNQSWVVGDSTADIAAANALGIRSVLVMTGEGGRDGKHVCVPDFLADDFNQASLLIARGAAALEAELADEVAQICAGEHILVRGGSHQDRQGLIATLGALLRERGLEVALGEAAPGGSGNSVLIAEHDEMRGSGAVAAGVRHFYVGSTTDDCDASWMHVDIAAILVREMAE